MSLLIHQKPHSKQKTPIELAAHGGHLRVFELLAPFSHRDRYLLDLAVVSRQINILNYVLEKYRQSWSDSTLVTHYTVLKILLLIKRNEQEQALQSTCQMGFVEGVEALCKCVESLLRGVEF